MNKDELMNLEKEEIIALLLGIIDQLTAEIAELKVQLNQNSKNSSRPPSSDGFKKPKPKSLRKSSDKSIGGQKGHDGSGLKIQSKPNKIVVHEPNECANCQKKADCNASKVLLSSGNGPI